MIGIIESSQLFFLSANYLKKKNQLICSFSERGRFPLSASFQQSLYISKIIDFYLKKHNITVWYSNLPSINFAVSHELYVIMREAGGYENKLKHYLRSKSHRKCD